MKTYVIVIFINIYSCFIFSQTRLDVDGLYNYNDGYALVSKSKNAWLIDTVGNALRGPGFGFIPDKASIIYKEGVICIYNDEGGKYFDVKGRSITKTSQGFILPFKEGIGVYQSNLKILTNGELKQNGISLPDTIIKAHSAADGYEKTIRFINSNGEELFAKTIITWPGYGNQKPTNGFHNGYCILEVSVYIEGTIDMGYKYCILNKRGEQTGEFLCDSHGEFSEGLCAVKKGEKWGFVDTTGRLVIDCGLTYRPGDFLDEMAAFKGENALFGYIDTRGEVVINPQYAEAYPFHNGLAIIQMPYERTNMDYTYGYCAIDKDAKVVYRYGKEYVESDISDRLIIIKKNNMKGFMDIKGNIVIFPEFDELRPFNSGRAYALKKSKYGDTEGYIDGSGEFVIVKE